MVVDLLSASLSGAGFDAVTDCTERCDEARMAGLAGCARKFE